MEARVLAQLCRDLAENRKAEKVVVLDVRKISGITDYFVVATGSSDPHIRAIKDEVLDKLLKEHGIKPAGVDDSPHAVWVVIDYIDVIVHVMREDVRDRYDLEGLWGDAPRVRRSRAVKAKEPGAQAVAAVGSK